MSTRRQLTIKPSCMREISAFPAKRAGLLWDKINQLVSDPTPDGKVKKKLKATPGVCRLRVGDHRVFYRYGADWISLLGVRRRQEDTYKGIQATTEAPQLPPEAEDDLDALLTRSEPAVFQFEAKGSTSLLPRELTAEWLRDLKVPVAAIPTLLQCKTEEALLEAAVPGEVLTTVLDAIFPPSLEQLDDQPDLVVPSTEALVRYKAGDLLGFLLRLDEDQRKLTRYALKGPTMVRGGAGTGKSTVALYRVQELLERPSATGRERVLFTTYTQALLTVTKQLLEQLLTAEQFARVTVATCDQVARRIIETRRKIGEIEPGWESRKRLKALQDGYSDPAASAFEARLQRRALDRLSTEYIQEEFDWIIEGRDIRSLEDYLPAPRPGRGVAFQKRTRQVVWGLYEQFARGSVKERFQSLRKEALAIASSDSWSGHFDCVLVDEAQDLSPVSLALMAEICEQPEGLFFAADNKQSLYSRNYSWSSAHPRLNFRGRTSILKRNYRSTREIDRAAFGVLRPEEGEKLKVSTSIHEGPLPVLVEGIASDSVSSWIARFIRQMARHLHLKPSASAVLVPAKDIGEAVAEGLRDEGLQAQFFAGRAIDLKADVVCVLTLHAAKGLEFPIVVVGGLEAGTYPVADDFDDEGLFEERVRHERRLLYVGLTRAMRGLMLLAPAGCGHPALLDLDRDDWHVDGTK